MHYLGLGPDDEYDERGGYQGVPAPSEYDEPAGYGAVAETPAAPEPPPTLRPAPGPGAGAPMEPAPSAVRPVATPPAPRDVGVRSTGSVRPVAVAAQLHEVAPRHFNDVQEVGDRFKAGQPVAMDLAGADRELSRRLIDFSSGLCYALGGAMERVGAHTYLVVPSSARVSPEDRERLAAADGD
jgi:cell division inhibitor SepF